MTPQQRLRVNARSSPAELAVIASRGRWLISPHLFRLARLLKAVERGELARLIVTMPPRHGKSELISHYFPPWFLGRNPDARVILASYEHNFAASWGAKARDVLTEYGAELFGVTVRRDRSAADEWQLAGHEGGMVCAGVGGPITGRGADLLVLDDPVKNWQEAHSSLIRERAWDWWRSTAYTRLEPGGRAVVVMTRWHEDDLGGRIVADAKAGGEAWTVLNLPALAEEGDSLGRAPNEALWPERFPSDQLERIHRQVGGYVWDSLYQGRPAAPEGALFKTSWFPRRNLPGVMKWIAQAWDTAVKAGESNDYSACVTVGMGDDGLLHVLDVWRARLEAPELKAAIKRKAEEWRPGWVAIEDASVATAVIQMIVREERIPVVPVKCDRDKVTRAHGVTPYCEQGKVVFPANGAVWLPDFEDEMRSFPHGAHDDQVDAFVHVLTRALGGGEVKFWGMGGPSENRPGALRW